MAGNNSINPVTTSTHVSTPVTSGAAAPASHAAPAPAAGQQAAPQGPAAAQQAPPAAGAGQPAGPQGAAAGAPPAVPEDNVDLSATAAQQADEQKKKKAQEEEEARAAQQQHLDDEQQQLDQLDKQVNDTRSQLTSAVAKGDQATANKLQGQMGDLLKQREGLEQQYQNDLSAFNGNNGGTGHAGTGAQTYNPTTPMTPGAGSMGAPSMGMPGGGMAFPPGMMSAGAGNPAGIMQAPSGPSPTPPTNLQGNDKKTADFINNYLKEHNSPADGQHAGEFMVQAGKQYHVDPLILLSIAGQETNFGKTGIGANGMLGVGAYDSNPNNAVNNPTFSGVANQIRVGAETFAKLRAKGGSSETDSVAQQAAAVNSAGWATDGNWHNGVTSEYRQIASAASHFDGVA